MEIKQKPYNMLCTIIYFIFSSIYSLLMLREATFLNRYYWKMTQISAILWYFWSIWAFYSPKEISMTLIWPSLMLKIKSYYLVWLAIPESLAERLTLSVLFNPYSQCFPPFWKVSNIPFSTSSKGKQCPFLIILAKIPFFYLFPKNFGKKPKLPFPIKSQIRFWKIMASLNHTIYQTIFVTLFHNIC